MYVKKFMSRSGPQHMLLYCFMKGEYKSGK